jgi:predicted transcriptional regulator/transcriptional regulator with XRE-family HTH domain
MESALIGQKLREIRLEQGLRQADLARQLGISPAYLNLLEKGRRTMQFPLLMRALDVLAVELDGFMASIGQERPDDVLAALLDHPLAKTLELDEHDLARLRAEPKAATTIAALFNLYKNTRAQLDTATSKLEAGGPPRLDYAPGDEVTDFLQSHKNYVPELEAHAAEIRQDAALPQRVLAEQLVEVLRTRLGMAVELVASPPGTSIVRSLDRERNRLRLSPDLYEHALKFQLAYVMGLRFLDDTGLHDQLVAAARPRHAETARLIKIHLANYFAGALLLPYEAFFAAVQETRYDVEQVAALFAMSYEAVAHRMCNLSDPRRPGVPLHFLRVDVGGNISKRYSASGLRFPQGHGTCPKWAVHNAFLTPAVVTRQYSLMPDGAMYFCAAKVQLEPRRGSLVRGTTYSIGLGCAAENARHFVYADGLPTSDLARTAVPVGLTCRFCERTDCNQRAAPSYKFAFAVDEYNRKDNFFSPLTQLKK